jgi:hypothetical protein
MSSILPLPPGVVGEFVGRSHVDLSRVTEILNQYPTVIHAAFDWGNGDWETALGAAAHSGRKDIAEFLVGRGARMDIFAAAMLGRLSLVRAFLHESPGLLHQGGPHGIPLIDHARKGGDRETIAFLNHLLHPEKKKLSGGPSHGAQRVHRNGKTRPVSRPKPARSSKPKRRRAA